MITALQIYHNRYLYNMTQFWSVNFDLSSVMLTFNILFNSIFRIYTCWQYAFSPAIKLCYIWTCALRVVFYHFDL